MLDRLFGSIMHNAGHAIGNAIGESVGDVIENATQGIENEMAAKNQARQNELNAANQAQQQQLQAQNQMQATQLRMENRAREAAMRREIIQANVDQELAIKEQRKILIKFGKTNFTSEEIKIIENDYDMILKNAEEQNKEISSTYWREKENTLLNRLRKYKNTTLLFIHDFELPYDNNHMERLLRMIKGKTKVSGGFRSNKGGERFGRIMSIIKTSKLRKINPLNSVKNIYEGNVLFG